MPWPSAKRGGIATSGRPAVRSRRRGEGRGSRKRDSPKAIVARAAVSTRPVCALLAAAAASHFHGCLLTARRTSSSSSSSLTSMAARGYDLTTLTSTRTFRRARESETRRKR